MSGIVNSTGAVSGVVGTTVGTPASTQGQTTSGTNYDRPADGEYATDSYTKLLLHFNNNVTDSSGEGVTVTNTNASFDSGNKKIGSHGINLAESSSKLVVADNNNWDLGTVDWTIDWWSKYTTTSGEQYFLSLNPMIYFRKENSSNNHSWQLPGVSGSMSTAAADWGNNTDFHHYAVVRNGPSCKAYVDGVEQGSTTVGTSSFGSAGTFYIGVEHGGSTGYSMFYLDEFRWSLGIARWINNFKVY